MPNDININLIMSDNNESTRSQGAMAIATIQNSLQLRKTAIIIYLCHINFISSATNGLFVIGLPIITKDLNLLGSLAFWPLSIGGLTAASTLLPAGSVADIIGSRYPNLIGCLINGISISSCGLVQRGDRLVVLRAFQGVGLAMHLSTSVALVAQTFPPGTKRNVSFSCLGLSQPLGFSFGLVIGGVLIETIGWRFGCYLYGGLTLLLTAFGCWIAPKTAEGPPFDYLLRELRDQVDWIGSCLITVSIALISYYLA